MAGVAAWTAVERSTGCREAAGHPRADLRGWPYLSNRPIAAASSEP